MAIDFETEKLVRIPDERHLLPGPTPTVGQIRLWFEVGLKRDTKIISLETIKIGGLRYTSIEAYRRFVKRTNDDLGEE